MLLTSFARNIPAYAPGGLISVASKVGDEVFVGTIIDIAIQLGCRFHGSHRSWGNFSFPKLWEKNHLSISALLWDSQTVIKIRVQATKGNKKQQQIIKNTNLSIDCFSNIWST